jgi:hypothetical protein
VSSFTQWQILLAWIESTDRTPPDHPHPCIYLGPSPHLRGGIKVIGITSDFSYRDQLYSVELPGHPGGHIHTGLDRPSLAQTFWRPDLPPTLVIHPLGYTPEPQRTQIANLLRMISDNNRAARQARTT